MPENLPYPGDPNYLPKLAELRKAMQEMMDLQTAGVTLTPEQQATWDTAFADADAMVKESFVEGGPLSNVTPESTARDRAIARDPEEQFKEGGPDAPPIEVAPAPTTTSAQDTGLISDTVDEIFADDAMKQKKRKAQEEDGVKTLTAEEINAAN